MDDSLFRDNKNPRSSTKDLYSLICCGEYEVDRSAGYKVCKLNSVDRRSAEDERQKRILIEILVSLEKAVDNKKIQFFQFGSLVHFKVLGYGIC